MATITSVESLGYNAPDGMTMGSAITEKISFYGVSTVVQYPSVTAASTYTVSSSVGIFGLNTAEAVTTMVAQLSSVVAALKALGLIA